jgi:glycosyltransferase involved in cell wall biosynthesis
LAVVVITRNEAHHIGACLEAITQAVSDFPGTPIVVGDSDSNDDTVAIALRYPVTVYRYRASVLTAAAGRRIGFDKVNARYVLFVDGDCCIEASWLKPAMELILECSDIAVVSGLRRESFEGVTPAFRSTSPAPEEYDLGGNALYCSDVLHQVGGFNPFIISGEDDELLGRIKAAGYRAIRTPEVMYTHHTMPKDTMQDFMRRHSRGMNQGFGQVLRVSLRQGLFTYHARRLNRYLLLLGYLAFGAIFGIVGGLLSRPLLPLAWVVIGVLAFAWLYYRRRSIRGATYIVADWLIVVFFMVAGFLKRPQSPEKFAPQVEKFESFSIDTETKKVDVL